MSRNGSAAAAARERALSRRSAADLPHLLVGERRPRRSRRRARRPRPARRAPRRRTQTTVSTRPRAASWRRCAASDPGQPQHGQRQADDEHDGQQPTAATTMTTAPAVPDRVAEQADRGAEVRLVEQRVERAVRGRREAHVEDPDDGQQPEHQADHERGDPARARRQQHEQHGEQQPLERDAHERGRGQLPDAVRRDQGEPDQQRSHASEDRARRHHDRRGEPSSGSTAERSSRTCVPVTAAPRARDGQAHAACRAVGERPRRRGAATATRRRARTTRSAAPAPPVQRASVSGHGSSPAATTVNVTPWTAATTLRQ